jgi:hypothetical protein
MVRESSSALTILSPLLPTDFFAVDPTALTCSEIGEKMKTLVEKIRTVSAERTSRDPLRFCNQQELDHFVAFTHANYLLESVLGMRLGVQKEGEVVGPCFPSDANIFSLRPWEAGEKSLLSVAEHQLCIGIDGNSYYHEKERSAADIERAHQEKLATVNLHLEILETTGMYHADTEESDRKKVPDELRTLLSITDSFFKLSASIQDPKIPAEKVQEFMDSIQSKEPKEESPEATLSLHRTEYLDFIAPMKTSITKQHEADIISLAEKARAWFKDEANRKLVLDLECSAWFIPPEFLQCPNLKQVTPTKFEAKPTLHQQQEKIFFID